MTLAAIHSGLQAPHRRQEAAAAVDPSQTPAHKKLVRAAQEFEGMLISQLLGDFKSGLSSFAGDGPLAGSDTLNSMAVQTLSGALARQGGLGIGRMLVHQLEPSLSRGGKGTTGNNIKTASSG
jgi:Rod binding domain-containing protein